VSENEESQHSEQLSALASLLQAKTGPIAVLCGPGAAAAVGLPQPGRGTLLARSLESALAEEVELRCGRRVRTVVEQSAKPGAKTKALLTALGQEDVRREILRRFWQGMRPADAHRALAALARDSLVQSLVQTGYDRLLEEAFLIDEIPYTQVSLSSRVTAGGDKPTVGSTDALRAIDDQDTFLPSELAGWLLGRGFSGGIILVCIQSEAVLQGVEKALKERPAPLWVISEKATAMAARFPQAMTVSGGAGAFLEALCSELGVEKTKAFRKPAPKGRVRALLQKRIDTRPVLRSIPIVGGYGPVINKIPGLPLHMVLWAIILVLCVIGGLNFGSYWFFQRSWKSADEKLIELRDEFAKQELSSCGEIKKRLKKQQIDALDIEIPGAWFVLEAVERSCKEKKAQLIAEILHFDNYELDKALYLHAMTDFISNDQRYNTFGCFPDPPLEELGHPRNLNDDSSDDLLKPLSALLKSRESVALVDHRDLVLDVLKKRIIREALNSKNTPVVADLLGYVSGSLENRFFESIRERGGFKEGDLNRAAVRSWLESGSMVLVVSHLDQARALDKAILAIERLQELFPKNSVIVSLGQEGMRTATLNRYRVYRVRRFKRRRVLQWLEGEEQGRGELAHRLRLRPRILKIVQDPLLLSLLLDYQNNTGQLPGTWMQLIDHFVADYLSAQSDEQKRLREEQRRRKELYESASKNKKTNTQDSQGFKEVLIGEALTSVSAKKDLFSRLARYIWINRLDSLDSDQAVMEIARSLSPTTATDRHELRHQIFKDQPGTPQLLTAEPVLQELLETGLLTRAPNNRVRFADDYIRHYFQARSERSLGFMTGYQANQRFRQDHLTYVAGLSMGPRLFERILITWRRLRLSRKAGYTQSYQQMLRSITRIAGQLEQLPIGYENEILELLAQGLHSKFRRYADEAFLGFEDLGRQRSVLRLFRELNKADDELTLKIIEFAGRSGIPVAAKVLRAHYQKSDQKPRIREACLKALAVLGTSDSVAFLQAIMDSDQAPLSDQIMAARWAFAKKLDVKADKLIEKVRADPQTWASLLPYLPLYAKESVLPLCVELLDNEELPDSVKDCLARNLVLFGEEGENSEQSVYQALGLAKQGGDGAQWIAWAYAWLLSKESAARVGEILDRSSEMGSEKVFIRSLLALGVLQENKVLTKGTFLTRVSLKLSQQTIIKSLNRAGENAGLKSLLELVSKEGPGGSELLNRWLGKTSPRAWQLSLIEFLGRSGEPTAVPFLTAIYQKAGMKKAVIKALGEIKHWSSRRWLYGQLGREKTLRWETLTALSKVWNRSDVSPFVSYLKSRDKDRWRALMCLAKTRSPEAAAVLIAYFKDRRSPRRELALDALIRLGDPSVLVHLRSELKKSEPGGPKVLVALLKLFGALGKSAEDAKLVGNYASWTEEPVYQAAYDAWWAISARAGR
jgi:hypothetical protein